jgi:hypothetical protein
MKDFIFYRLPPLAWMAFIFPTNDALTVNSTSRIIVPIIKWFLPHASVSVIIPCRLLISEHLFVSSYGGDNDIRFTPDIGCPVIHGDAERPLIGTPRFFVS